LENVPAVNALDIRHQLVAENGFEVILPVHFDAGFQELDISAVRRGHGDTDHY